jgi:hypothetical protein
MKGGGAITVYYRSEDGSNTPSLVLSTQLCCFADNQNLVVGTTLGSKFNFQTLYGVSFGVGHDILFGGICGSVSYSDYFDNTPDLSAINQEGFTVADYEKNALVQIALSVGHGAHNASDKIQIGFITPRTALLRFADATEDTYKRDGICDVFSSGQALTTTVHKRIDGTEKDQPIKPNPEDLTTIDGIPDGFNTENAWPNIKIDEAIAQTPY